MAATLYQVDTAPRPTVALRKLGEATWASATRSVAVLALRLQERFRCSDRAAAEEAVALAAERGSWVPLGGSTHPASFRHAVKLVRAEMAAQRRGNRPGPPDGNTGKRLFVRPAGADLIVRDLDHPDRQPIPPEGKEVSDTAYWRRRVACGDVIEVREARK